MRRVTPSGRPYVLDMRTVAAILALTLFGCAAGPRPSHYTVSISPMFTADQTTAILAGLDSWTTAVPELALGVSIGDCRADVFCVLPVTLPANQVGYDYEAEADNVIGVDAAKLTIDARIARMTFGDIVARTVAHEMGHRMIAPGHTAAGTLMAADTLHQAQAPTAVDIARWREAR